MFVAKKTYLMLLILPVIGIFWQSAHAAAGSSTEQIKAVLGAQADAWNKGDLDAFMTGYLQSPDTSYTSGGTEVWGYDALRQRYQNKYGASKDTMGNLTFSDLKVFDLGAKDALCIGHWHLEPHDKPQVNGVFSLVLVRARDGWKIMHDHTSTIQ